jgi:ABC-type lipoprotein release transport system permease subunit
MKIFDVSQRSARNLKQAKARTLLTAMAIGVGAFALTMTLAASNGAQSYVNRLISNNFDPTELLVAKDEEIQRLEVHTPLPKK